MRNSTSWMTIVSSLAILSLSIGCSTNNPTPLAAQQQANELSLGYQSLELKQYDEAQGRADSYLKRSPRGPQAAEALYLRGRAFEQRPSSDAETSATNI